MRRTRMCSGANWSSCRCRQLVQAHSGIERPVWGQVWEPGIEKGAARAQARPFCGGKPALRGVWDDGAAVASADERTDPGSANDERVPAPEAAGPARKPPAEAVAEARVRAPSRGNRKLEAFLEAVNGDDQV